MKTQQKKPKLTRRQLELLRQWQENMEKPIEPDSEFEAFLQQESQEIDEILASLDRTKDALYVQFHDAEVIKTIELAEDELLIDLDERGNVLGIEVLKPGI